jgi:hypothetical protein
MKRMRRFLGTLMMLSLLGGTVAIAGCAARMYDADHNDYHRWNHQENVFYVQWEQETHRDHRNFRDRDDNEKR